MRGYFMKVMFNPVSFGKNCDFCHKNIDGRRLCPVSKVAKECSGVCCVEKFVEALKAKFVGKQPLSDKGIIKLDPKISNMDIWKL